jgi:RsiW-degrading membrane proteinase PrsW (M82 family)
MSTPNAPTIVVRPSPQISAIRLVLAIVAVLVALVLGLLVLLVIGIETGPVALLLGLVTATIPVPLYVVLVLWIDRYEAEPLWMLATAFFWGALVSTFFAFILNTTSGIVVGVLTDASAGQAFSAVISAPVVEEIGKAVILFIFSSFDVENTKPRPERPETDGPERPSRTEPLARVAGPHARQRCGPRR